MKSFVVKVEELFRLSEKSSAGEELFQKDICNLRIPLYQREYKWDKLRVSELLEDVISKQKLLGIVLLDENRADGVYDIVDGQQRVTTILFILMELYNLLTLSPLDQQTVYEVIHNKKEFVLKNDSFGSNYIIEKDGQLKVEINNDIYYQIPVVEEAFKAIKEGLAEKERYTEIVSNILKCQFVVIVNKDAAGAFQDPVEQIFLDINEKSQRLDAEDIFKGHCFKNFDGSHIETVKEDWEKLKASGMTFCKKFMKDENISAFLYHYLLIREGREITDRLTLGGKHYLYKKNKSETHDLLANINLAASSIISEAEKLIDEDYRLDNLSKDIKVHRKEKEIKTCRILLKEILELKSADFPKFPTYYFLYKLLTKTDLQDEFKASDIREIISNLYIYTFIFAYTEGRKGKSLIDYTVRDAFLVEDDSQIVSSVKKASRDLRKQSIANSELDNSIKRYKTLAFYYSILDFYDLGKMAFTEEYVSKKADTNLEHFIMPDANGIEWYRGEGDTFKIKVDEAFWRSGKKCTINYLIIDETLNENMESFDIVKKIEDIRAWYKREELPRHVEVIISDIEKMPSYLKLKKIKNDNEKDNALIKESYLKFLNDYFSEEHKALLTGKIWDEIKRRFI